MNDIGWNYPTLDDVLQLHAAALLNHDQGDTSRNAGCVDGALGASQSAALYSAEDGNPDLIVAAAYLLRSLAVNHCFGDGNKRVAWSAMLHVLRVNDIGVQADQEDAAAMVVRVAEGKLDAEGVVAWLCAPGRIVRAV